MIQVLFSVEAEKRISAAQGANDEEIRTVQTLRAMTKLINQVAGCSLPIY